MKAIESLKQAIIHGQMIGCNSNKPQLVREQAVDLTGLLQEALAELEAQPEPGELAEELRKIKPEHISINCPVSTEIPNQAAGLIDRLEAENKLLKEENDGLLKLTELLDEHPENYEGPCWCKLCQSYA